MKIICNKCKGNGYITVMGYDLEQAILQCDTCNSQGEIEDIPKEKVEFKPINPPLCARITYQSHDYDNEIVNGRDCDGTPYHFFSK